MKPLLFILRKSLKNYIKELRKKPVVMIAYIVMVVFFLLMTCVSFIMPSGSVAKRSPELFGAIVTVALFIFLYFGIKQGISNGSSFFRFSDVNFLFTAPISPKKVLIYGFVQQLFVTLFIVVFISFQIPNLRNNFPIKSYGVFIIYAGIFFLFFTMQLIGLLIYSIASKSAKIRSIFQKTLTALVLAFGAGFLIVMFNTRDFMAAAVKYLDNPVFDYFPFFGWFKEFLMSAVYGITPSFYISLLLIAASSMLAVFVIYKLKAEYYEDVLAATERKEQMIAAKKEGRTEIAFRDVKARKIRFKFEGTGAKAIFYRHMLEYRKTGFFFINRNSLIVIGFGLAAKYFFGSLSEGLASSGRGIVTTLFASIYMLFILSVQGKWGQELNRHYIYLIPDSSSRKVFYATLTETIKNLIDGVLLFTAAGIMFKADVPSIVLSVLAYTTFGMIFTYGDVLSRRLFGEAHSKNLQMMFKMLLILVIAVPEIVTGFIMGFFFGNLALFITIILYNLLVSFLILISCKGIFEKLEMK